MIDNYKILTLTFSDARLDALADYLLPSDDQNSGVGNLVLLKEDLGVEELFYLSTCNRVLYLCYSGQTIAQLHDKLISFLRKKRTQNGGLELNTYSGEDAVRHFFDVTASLKSMVVGEQEILRQVKEAYEHCWSNGLSGDQIRILFQSALQTAKAVHHKTRISEKTVSVVSLAMKKLRRLGIHSEDEVILIGAGDTMQKVAKFLREWGMKKVKVFNRSEANLDIIKQILPGADTYLLDELNNHNLNVPYIISCTGHNDYLLTTKMVQGSNANGRMSNNRGILDLAVPRDVHPELVTRYGLKVIEVESLRTVAEKNKDFRKNEVAVARKIVDKELELFREKVHRRFIERAFQEIPAMIYATRDKALHEIYKNQIETLDEDGQELIKEIMDYMARKCISIPMKTARKQYSAIRKDMTRHYFSRENSDKS